MLAQPAAQAGRLQQNSARGRGWAPQSDAHSPRCTTLCRVNVLFKDAGEAQRYRERLRLHRDRIAPGYASSDEGQLVHTRLATQVVAISQIKPGERVLDISAGEEHGGRPSRHAHGGADVQAACRHTKGTSFYHAH